MSILTYAKTIDNKPTVIYAQKADKASFPTFDKDEKIAESAKTAPISYWRITVIAHTEDGSKCAAFEKSVLINGATSTVSIIGAVNSTFTEKTDLGFVCTIETSSNLLQIVGAGLDKTEVTWIIHLDKVI